MSVMLTEKAASEVKKIIVDQKLDQATVLRVGVAFLRGGSKPPNGSHFVRIHAFAVV